MRPGPCATSWPSFPFSFELEAAAVPCILGDDADGVLPAGTILLVLLGTMLLDACGAVIGPLVNPWLLEFQGVLDIVCYRIQTIPCSTINDRPDNEKKNAFRKELR